MSKPQKAVVAAIVAVVIVGVLVALMVSNWSTAPDRPAMPTVKSNPAHPTAEFDDGTRVKLGAVGHFIDGQQWWGADGSPATATVEDTETKFRGSLGGHDTKTRFGVEFRLYVQPRDRDDSRFLVGVGEERALGAMGTFWDGPDGVILSAVHSFPKEQEEAELHVGTASGPWLDKDIITPEESQAREAVAAAFIGTNEQARAERQASTAAVPTTDLHILSVTGDDGETVIACTGTRFWNDWNQNDWRFTVEAVDGSERRHKKVRHNNGVMSFMFDLPVNEVVAAKYQVRPRVWKSLGTVRLQPTTRPITR